MSKKRAEPKKSPTIISSHTTRDAHARWFLYLARAAAPSCASATAASRSLEWRRRGTSCAQELVDCLRPLSLSACTSLPV